MRYRMVHGTGLGNPDTPLMINNVVADKYKELMQEALQLFFSKFGYCDIEVGSSYIRVGVEPAYQYEYLKYIEIHRNKEHSRIINGRAWGLYGSGIAQNTRVYSQYQNKSKFVKFVDKWHSQLY